MSTPSSYGAPGAYTSGVWLVSLNGSAAIVDRAHLPPQGKGYQYYWLGSTVKQAGDRVAAALGKLNVVTDQPPVTDPNGKNPAISKALSTGIYNLNFDELQPGLLPWQSPSPTSSYAQGVHSAGQSAQQATASAGDAAGVLRDIANYLVAGSTWVRILKYIAGAVLIFMGIKALLGVSGPNIPHPL